MIGPPRLILASASPRRRELLAQIRVSCTQSPVHLPEERRDGESPRDFVRRMALEKAAAGWQRQPPGRRLPVLGADTEVVLDEQVLGKPRGTEHALEMLASLSGREHGVLSAVALCGEETEVRLSASRVRFREISAAERAAYVATGEPMDKAGAYAIQGRAAVFVEHLEGSYSGVMGLPLFETAALLTAQGIEVLTPGRG